MKHRSVLLLLLLLTAFRGSAQSFYSAYENGFMLGGSQYFGDLNEEYGLKFIRPAAGLFVRRHFNSYIALRGSVSYTRVGYDDKLNSAPFNKLRNLNFQSDVVEASLQAEFSFFRFTTGQENNRFTPYLTGGVGAFYYNPYTDYGGKKYYLRPLGTEGQNAGFTDRRYGSVAVCFPVGAGVKYWLMPGVNLGFEIADRLTLTDYLDDVSTTYVGEDKFPHDVNFQSPAYLLQDRSASTVKLGRAGKQRGNSTSFDQYMYAVFTLSFQVKVYRCPNYLKNDFLQ